MEYTVGELAKKLHISPSALRYYDKEGLIPTVTRSAGGARIFTDQDIRWLNLIHCLKSAGMSLKDIHAYIDMTKLGEATLEDRLQMFQNQRQQILRQMEDLKQTLDVVDYKCWYYETALEHQSEAVPKEMPLEAVPQKHRAVRQWLRAEP